MVDDRQRRLPMAAWWHAGLAGVLAAAVMIFEALSLDRFDVTPSPWIAVTILATVVAVALYRIRPGAALVVVWGAGLCHAISGERVLASQVAVCLLAYGIGRYGSRLVLAAGAMSVMVAVPLGILLIVWGYAGDSEVSLTISPWFENAVAVGGLGGLTWTLLPTLALPLVVPLLIGVSLRMWDRSRRSAAAMEEAQREQAAGREREQQAQQLAALRDGQTRLARDVHDVVGHSLTVILAQSQSAQYLDSDLNPDVRRALAAIADTARASLKDVRSILTATQEDGTGGTAEGTVPHDFQRMIDDVRAAGTPLHVNNLGDAHPLPPDQAVTLYRVLQEMLTNVLKHGSPGSDVEVTFDWRSGLVVRVSNEAHDSTGGQAGDQRGLIGMTERMAAVGGTLSTERSGTTFTVSATFPHAADRRAPRLPAEDGALP